MSDISSTPTTAVHADLGASSAGNVVARHDDDRRTTRRSTETKASLTIGYMVSRGLAKSGSRDYDDSDGR